MLAQWRETTRLPVHRGQILTTVGAKILFLFNQDAARLTSLVSEPLQVPHDNLLEVRLPEDTLTSPTLWPQTRCPATPCN